MPGLDMGNVGYDMSGKVAAAVPYSWEAAPGKPMSDVVNDSTELTRTPLPPPPGPRGVRKPLTFVEPTFGGFEPEPHDVVKSSGPHFAEKLFKKLQRKLRKKSKVLAASFSVENIRALTEHRKRTVGVEDCVQSRSDDSDERVGGSWSSSSTFEQPDTPCSTDSVSLNSMSSMSSLSNASTSWESISYHSALHQDGSQRNVDLLLSMSASCDDDFQDEVEDSRGSPRESAWHEEAEEEDELTEQEWQIVRYATLQGDSSSLISTLVRQSSLTPLSEYSYRFSPIKGRKSEQQQ
jgi:hypothetical protein